MSTQFSNFAGFVMNKNYYSLILVVAGFLTFSTSAFALNIGFGYSCEQGIVIQKDGTGITKKMAKRKLTREIKAKERSLLDLAGKPAKIKKVKTKIRKLKKTRNKVEACIRSTSSVFASLVGDYHGEWVNQTFNTSGELEVELELEGNILTATIDIDGFMFGSLNPAPFQISFDATGKTLPAQYSIIGTPIGNLAVQFNQDSSFSVVETSVPGLLNFIQDASMTASTFDESISGVFSSKTIGNIPLATGAFTVHYGASHGDH